MDDKTLDAYCEDWAHWARTRKYFAPPVPPNILATLQPRRGRTREPDGPMDADLAFFNMALHRIAEDQPDWGACFSLYYFHRAANVKAIAAKMEITPKTFYNRAHAFAKLAMKWSPVVKRAHLAMSGKAADVCNENYAT